jgi:hypothetical protein
VPVIGCFRFEQLRVRQDDPQLVVQLVEKPPHFRAGFNGVGVGTGELWGQVHAGRPAVWVVLAAMTRVVDVAASLHSVSAKMRIDPPAVRTYSTLPAAIQL